MTAPRYEWTVGSGVPDETAPPRDPGHRRRRDRRNRRNDPPAARQRPCRQGSGRSDLAARLADPSLRAGWAGRLVLQAGEPVRAPDDRRGTGHVAVVLLLGERQPPLDDRHGVRPPPVRRSSCMSSLRSRPGALRGRGERIVVGAAYAVALLQRRRPDARVASTRTTRSRSPTLRDSPQTSCGPARRDRRSAAGRVRWPC